MTAIPLTDEARARLAAAHEELEGDLGLSCSTSCGRDCSTVLGCAPTDGEPLREQSTTTTPGLRPNFYGAAWQFESGYSEVPAGLEALVRSGSFSKVEHSDPVNAPAHYTSHPSGVECRTIARHMSYNLGSAFKYIWRAGLKGDAVQDLRKAVNALEDEIARLEAQQ